MANVIVDPEHGYLRLEPIPSADEVKRYYAEEFYARADTDFVNDSSVENMEQEAEYHQRSYQDFVEIISDYLPEGMDMRPRLVDIGSGYGHFLKFANQRNFDVFGIEPVTEGIEFQREHGIECAQAEIEELGESPLGPVDVVAMINVLEHLRNPAAVLSHLRAHWLKPGGLVLLRVPNDFNVLQLAASEIHNLDQWWVAPPRHINYFNHGSLSRLLENLGFEVLSRTSTFPLEFFLLMGDVYVGNGVLGKTCHRKRVEFERSLETAGYSPFRRELYKLFGSLGIGREIVLLAKAC